MSEKRSAKVRKVLHLEGRGAALRARYECALVPIAPTRHRAEQCLQQAKAIKATLTPAEVGQLRRAERRVTMTTRIELDFHHGLTEPRVEHAPDGPRLSLTRGRQDTREAAARFFSLLDRALAPLGERITPLRVAVPLAVEAVRRRRDTRRTGLAGSGARPRRRRDERARAPRPSPPGDGRGRGAARAGGGVRAGRTPARPPGAGDARRAVARACAVVLGDEAAREPGGRAPRPRVPRPVVCLTPGHAPAPDRPLLRREARGLGGPGRARARSLTLLLAPCSAFAFAPEVPEVERPGVYHPLARRASRAAPHHGGALRPRPRARLALPGGDRPRTHCARPGRGPCARDRGPQRARGGGRARRGGARPGAARGPADRAARVAHRERGRRSHPAAPGPGPGPRDRSRRRRRGRGPRRGCWRRWRRSGRRVTPPSEEASPIISFSGKENTT